MSILHYLNVLNGDCSIIKHNSGRVTVFDVNNAYKEEPGQASMRKSMVSESFSVPGGNYNQKKHPVNPISYLKKFGIGSIFRFILSHPDMDHMGGIKAFFENISVSNFWDTKNDKEMDSFDGTPYNQDDWEYYQELRKGTAGVKVLNLYDGSEGQYYNQNENGTGGGDGITILAPTEQLVQEANESGDYNDCSYVILYQAAGKKIVFGGDSNDKTWEHILGANEELVSNIDILLAPHHGRKSGRSYDFLDVLQPKVTFFGNASCEHLAYDAWNSRGLLHLQNNQGNCLIADIKSVISLYCTYKTFAENFAQENGYSTFYDSNLDAWYLGIL